LVPASSQQIINKVLLVKKNVDIVIMVGQKNSSGFDIRGLAGQMERSSDDILRVSSFHCFELTKVFQLASANVHSLDRVPGEAGQNLSPVLLHSHCVRSLKFQV
jgi:hypothetical protein